MFFASIALFSIISIVFLKLTGNAPKAAWYDDAWIYRTPITISNSGAGVTNQKVNLTINTAALISAGKLQADCDDSRFTTVNGIAVPYYLESGCNTVSTSYWVLMPTIEGTPESTVVYHYYGNNAVASNSRSSNFAEATFTPSATSGGTEEKGTPPVASYKFDEGNGVYASDNSGNQNPAYFGSGASGNTKIRQEINITNAIVNAAGDDAALVQLDTTQYSGTPSYYFEIVGTVASGTLTVALERKGTATQDATITVTETSFTRKRSTAFTPPAGQTEYNINLSGGTTPQVKAARIIIIQDLGTTALTKTETQIEVGNDETGKTNTSDAALTNPKYWNYTASRWTNPTTFYAEVTYLKAADVSSGSTSYTTAGTSQFVPAAGVTSVQVELWGGGGAGGGTTVNGTSKGGGGAGGQYVIKQVSVTQDLQHPVVVAATRTGGTSGNSSAGNDSTFVNVQAVAKGGAGGASGNNGGAAGSGSTTGGVGDTVYAGGNGSAGGATATGGAGGGGAGSTGTGNNASGNTAGAAKTANGGAGGAGRTTVGNGNAGSSAGGGGGGGYNTASATRTGGTGARGQALISWSAVTSTVTFKLQEDDGSFANWTDKATIVSAGTATAATRVRSSAFTPTPGRNYRIVSSTSNGNLTYEIHNAKIVVQQSGTITKLEPQYLVSNELLSAGTSLQNFDTYYDPAEWNNTTNTYYHEASGASGTTSSVKLQSDPNGTPADIANSAITPANRTRSAALTMPGSAQTIDVIATTNGNDIYSNSIVVAATVPPFAVTGTAPEWKTEQNCISGGCVYFDGSADNAQATNINAIDLDKQLAGSFTITTWIRATSLGEGDLGQVFNKGTNTYLRVAAGSVGTKADISASLDLGTTDATVTLDDGISLNVWHQVTLTYTDDADDEITVTVDGKASATSTNGVGSPATDSNTLILGGASTANFQGFIDEFRIYNYERSSTQTALDSNRWAAEKGGTAFGLATNYQLTDGLVGYWEMDENSGSAVADSSGAGKNGTYTNLAAGAWRVGRFGSGLEFNGTTQYMSFANPDLPTDDFTYATWINLDAATDENIFVMQDQVAGNDELRIWVNGTGKIVVYLNGSQALAGTTTAVSTGTWTHIAVTRTNGLVQVYFNGVVDATTATDATTLFFNTSCPAFIGVDQDSTTTNCTASPGNYFDGTIDDFRIYNRALSAGEIRTLYRWAPKPVAHWSFDKGTDYEVYDTSGSGYTGSWLGVGGPRYSSGKVSQAAHFTGSSSGDRIDMGDISELNDTGHFTITAWFKQDDPTAYARLFDKRIDGDNDITAASFSNNFYFEIGGGTGVNAYGYVDNYNTLYTAGQWIHATFVFNGEGSANADRLKIYFNGIEQTLVFSSTVPAYTQDISSASLFVSEDTVSRPGTNSAWNGEIDEMKIYNYNLDQKRIIEDMNGGHPAGGSPISSATGYWKFDEGYGDTIHDTGYSGISLDNGGSGTTCPGGGVSCASWTNAGKFGKGLTFAGTSYLKTSSDTPFDITGDFTLSAWVNRSGGGGSHIISKWSSLGTGGYILGVGNSGEIYCQSDNGTSVDTTQTGNGIVDASDGWVHLAAVRSGSTCTIYADGIDRTSSHGTHTTVAANNNQLTIGSDASPAQYFTGTIDEVRVYNYALTADEIAIVMNNGASALFSPTTIDNSLVPSWADDEAYCPFAETQSACSTPVAEWKMDEHTGTTINDTSTNGNVSQAFTGNVKWDEGKYGGGLNFDGNDDVVKITETTSTDLGATATSFTVEAWIKTSANYSANATIVAKNDGSGAYPYHLFVNSSEQACFQISDGTNSPSQCSSTTVGDGKWHHITGVRNHVADAVYLYVDGRRETAAGTTDSTTATAANNDDVSIGNSGTSYTGADFNGVIDQALIFNYARTPSQVQWDYNRGRPIVWFKMDDCQGTTIGDSAENAHGVSNGTNATLIIGATGTNTTAGTCNSGVSTEAWNNGTTGVENYSISFDGTNDYVNANYVPPIIGAGNDFAISLWIKTSSSAGTPEIASFNTASFGNKMLFYITTDDGSIGYTDTAGGHDIGTISITDGQWHHVVLALDDLTDSQVEIWVDGVRDTLSGSTSSLATNDTFSLAQEYDAGPTASNFLNALIDDVRVYRYVPDDDMIARWHTEGVSARFGPASGHP